MCASAAPTQLLETDGTGTAREHALSPLRAAGLRDTPCAGAVATTEAESAAQLESCPAQAGAKVVAKAPSSYRSTAARHAEQPSPHRISPAAHGARRSEWQHRDGRSRLPRTARRAAMHTTHSTRPAHARAQAQFPSQLRSAVRICCSTLMHFMQNLAGCDKCTTLTKKCQFHGPCYSASATHSASLVNVFIQFVSCKHHLELFIVFNP